MSLFPQVPFFGKAIMVAGLVLALFEAVVPHPMPPHVVPFVLAMLGLLYGGTLIDAESASDYLVVVIAVGGAGATDALSHIYFVGVYFDAMLDLLCISLFASAVSVLATRTMHRLGRSKRDSSGAPEPRPSDE